MSEIAELIEKVSKATGPSAEIDAAVVAWLNNATVRPYPPTDDFGPRNQWQFWSKDGAHYLGSESRFNVPPLTASLDAVIALVEKELPGWLHAYEREQSGLYLAWAWEAGDYATPAEAKTPALALLLALLKSKQSQEMEK